MSRLKLAVQIGFAAAGGGALMSSMATTGPTSIALGAAGMAALATNLVMQWHADRHRYGRAARRANTGMLADRHWPGALAGLHYVDAVLYLAPADVLQRLTDQYLTAVADPAVLDIERRAVHLLRAHRLWGPVRTDLAQMASWSGAAAQAATAALAAPFLGPADADRLAGAWRAVGLPLLSGGGTDRQGRPLCAPVPVGAGGPRIPADQVEQLARLAMDAISMPDDAIAGDGVGAGYAGERARLVAAHQTYVRTVADYGPIHWRAEQAARRTGRYAAVNLAVFALQPQAVQDTALATLVRDLIPEPEYATLTHTWHDDRSWVFAPREHAGQDDDDA